MSLSDLFSFGAKTSVIDADDLPDIFPMAMTRESFVETDTIHIYAKILTDVIERTQGLSDEQQALLWDNCLMSESSDGLITLLAKAMASRSDLYLVYNRAVQVIRKADSAEQAQIRSDYESKVKSDVGIYVSFKGYSKSDMVKLYSSLEYATIAGLHKSVNVSKAVQFKMNNMRASVSTGDFEIVRLQAVQVAKALGKGKDVIVDGEDRIETAVPDLTATKTSIDFLNQKRSFYLGLPEAYINGIQTGGLGTTGENDAKAIERGLKNYFASIVKPVLEALFDVKVSYKSQDFRQLTQALEAMKTFELTSEEYLSFNQKKRIIEGLLDVDPDENETEQDAPPGREAGPRAIGAPPVREAFDARTDRGGRA